MINFILIQYLVKQLLTDALPHAKDRICTASSFKCYIFN